MRMTGDRIEALHDIYNMLHDRFEVTTPHELLLKGHITAFRDKLQVMADKGQLRHTLSFNATEALAFVQLWQEGTVELQPYYALIIQAIFNILDKKIKTPGWRSVRS